MLSLIIDNVQEHVDNSYKLVSIIFIEEDEETRADLKEMALYMDYYVEFENLIMDVLGDNQES